MGRADDRAGYRRDRREVKIKGQGGLRAALFFISKGEALYLFDRFFESSGRAEGFAPGRPTFCMNRK